MLLSALLWGGGCGAEPGAPAAGERPVVSGQATSEAARADERERMVSLQIESRGVADPRVLDAMRRVPRHEFVPARLRDRAYDDNALPIEEGQTISQPYIVALMTELAHLDADSVVLEVGTGSGYQAAVLSRIAREVYTIEIVEPLARKAAATLARLGYSNIHTRVGDGWAGWPEAAPFDAIVVTAAPDYVPPALLEQLAPHGRLVIPVGGRGVQTLEVHERTDDGFRVEQVAPVMFVPMTGGDDAR